MRLKVMNVVEVWVLVLALQISMSLPALAVQTCNPNMLRSTPDARFSDNGSTVTDNQTGLIWAKCAEGQSGAACTGSVILYTWSAALNHAAGSTLAGQSDWRLPNIKELASIVEIACYNPSINTTYFPNTPSSRFWSASPTANYSGNAWVVSFVYGWDSSNLRSKDEYVRLVRGGQ